MVVGDSVERRARGGARRAVDPGSGQQGFDAGYRSPLVGDDDLVRVVEQPYRAERSGRFVG
jgi:hypothetical protein